MGCGDWNDGMNLVGEHGKGESVWLAFFLYRRAEAVRRCWPAIAANRPSPTSASPKRPGFEQNIEQHGWDGQWYRRAYFDRRRAAGIGVESGMPDRFVPQSWSVLSGAAISERAAQRAGSSATRDSSARHRRLIQLFDPPFDKSHLNPGYIKGYVPGVRENGGQYTHAAIWAVMAFAAAGDSDRAWELFR